MRTLKEMLETIAYDDELKQQFAAEIGVLVRKEREKNGMTTQQLSVLTGKSESCIYKVEHGQTKISFETMVCLCMALDVEIGTLVPQDFLFPNKNNKSVFKCNSD